MKKGLHTFFILAFVLCINLNAQTGEDKFLHLLLRNGLETNLLLKEHPSITFFDDSMKIASKDLYAIAKRADIRTITFATDIDTCIVHREVKEGRYYRIKGLTGNYVDASQTRSNETLTLSPINNSNINEVNPKS